MDAFTLPALVFEGKLLDGRNRQRACKELGIELVVQKIRKIPHGANGVIQSLNIHRRHLSKDEQYDYAKQCREAGESLRTIAEKIGVSHQTVKNIVENPTVNNLTVDTPAKITGKDGRVRTATPAKPEPKEEDRLEAAIHVHGIHPRMGSTPASGSQAIPPAQAIAQRSTLSPHYFTRRNITRPIAKETR